MLLNVDRMIGIMIDKRRLEVVLLVKRVVLEFDVRILIMGLGNVLFFS